MAKFKYRLQKVVEIRERKVKEQEQRVIEAKRALAEVDQRIDAKKNELRMAQQSMRSTSHLLLGAHDDYIHKCYADLDELAEERKEAEAKVLEEAKLLTQYQADVEALVKHKEKALEEWKDEEKRKELKQLDEVASQRFFRAQEQAAAEAAAFEASMDSVY